MIRRERNDWATLNPYLRLESGRQSRLKAEARAEKQDRRRGAEKDK